MGRGIAYPHKYHMLIDDNAFYIEYEEGEECGFDGELWDIFKDEVRDAFDAWDTRYKWVGREAHYWAETDRLNIGFDTSGACTCLFITPKTYQHNFSNEEVEYKIWRDVEAGFNKLLKLYPDLFSYWTSAWTSAPYTQPYKAER